MLLKQCARCGQWIPYGKTYCTNCQPIMDKIIAERKERNAKKSNAKYNQKRNPREQQFYRSMDWKILSRKYIADHQYRCERCGKIATETHHKIPIQTVEGWDRRLDYSNLECLCIECHNYRHQRYQKRETKAVK